MSDTKTDEATKTYTPERQAGEWMPAVVLDEQAERIQELERREALLTANVVACERRRSYHPPKPPVSMNDAEVHAWSLDEMAIDLAMVDTYTALTAAGFPWPTEPVDGETEADEPHDCDKEYRADCASCNGVAPGDVGRW